jgi:sulfur carrier protein
MKVVVNGQAMELPEGTTVEAVVERLGLTTMACAAEVNKNLVPKRERTARILAEGDIVEVVTLVGGG